MVQWLLLERVKEWVQVQEQEWVEAMVVVTVVVVSWEHSTSSPHRCMRV